MRLYFILHLCTCNRNMTSNIDIFSADKNNEWMSDRKRGIFYALFAYVFSFPLCRNYFTPCFVVLCIFFSDHFFSCRVERIDQKNKVEQSKVDPLCSGTPYWIKLVHVYLVSVFLGMIFLIGVFIYNEPLNDAKIGGFIFIWTVLFIYSIEGIRERRNS